MGLAFLKAKQSVTYLLHQIIEQYQDQVAIQGNIFFITQLQVNCHTNLEKYIAYHTYVYI